MTRGEYKTMAEAVEGLRGRGFTSDFTVANEGGNVTAGDRTFKSDDLTISSSTIASKECPIRTILLSSTRSKRRMDSKDCSSMPMAPMPIGRLEHCTDTHGGVDDAAA